MEKQNMFQFDTIHLSNQMFPSKKRLSFCKMFPSVFYRNIYHFFGRFMTSNQFFQNMLLLQSNTFSG